MRKMPDLIIWQGILGWMDKKGMTSATLARLTGHGEDRIERGIRAEPEPLSSDFLHACVDAFGLRSSRQRGIEDTADVLTDDECIELLMQTLIKRPR